MNVASFRWLLIVVTKIIYFVDANWITGNLCWSMPCMNGGSCFGSSYEYLCVCPINYSGALCEKRLGICQESPCGNRGLCVETGLTSFECRCYFDYMGPLCEEHIPKNDVSIWSSLVPVHTRVLFDILQEAYRKRARPRSGIDSHFNALLNTNDVSSSLSTTTLSTILKSNFITRQSETTEAEHIIPAEDIHLENIFPEISTISTSDKYTESFTTQTFETTQQNEYNNNEISFSTNMNSNMVHTIENIATTLIPLTTGENRTTVSMEQNQTNDLNITKNQEYVNITEEFNTMITSGSPQWSSYNSDNTTIVYTTETNQNSTEEISNNTEFQEFSQVIDSSSFETTTNDLSNQTDNYQFNSSEQTITSTLIPIDQTLSIDKSIDILNISQGAHSQLLLKLCQELLSHILPNVSSLSSSAAVEAALSLSAGSPSSGNNSADALLAWIKVQLNSLSTTTTTPVPSLLISEKKTSSGSLQRVDMDDVLHQMNDNIDGEN